MMVSMVLLVSVMSIVAVISSPRATARTRPSVIRIAKKLKRTYCELEVKVLPLAILEVEITLFIESKRLNLLSLLLILSNSSILVSRLSVTLHNSLTAPTFSMKILSLFTTRKFSIVSPSGRTTSPVSLTASGSICCTSCAKTPVSLTSASVRPTSLANLGVNWYLTIRMFCTFFSCSLVSSSSMFCLALWSDGCIIWPVTLTLP